MNTGQLASVRGRSRARTTPDRRPVAPQAGRRHPEAGRMVPFAGRRRENADRRTAVFAVLPALVVVGIVMFIPIGYALYLSFCSYDGVSATWIGLGNYIDLFQDSVFWSVLGTNLIYLLAVPLVVFAATICATLLFEQVWGWRAFRIIFFIPSVLSTAVIGVIFKSVFSYDGPVNGAIKAAGGHPVDFFSHGNTAIMAIILVLVWSGFGYGTLIVLSGMSAIDPEIFQAARVDGAGWWQRFFLITLPNITGVLAFVSLLNVIYTFTSLFGLIFVMTAGGPGYETTTLDYLVYQRAFSANDMGSGAALAVVVFLLIGALTVVQLKLSKPSED